jgi:hypothetical protein
VIPRLVSLVSGLVFLAGCLAIVLGAVIAWVTVIVTACIQVGWPFGAVLLVGSFGLLWRYEAAVKAPWFWWAELWRWGDDRLRERLTR